ncbi:MAG: AAA family ATPase [Ruminococcus sp.]|nr:AAA family ATPase [Ruminococcus sp.]
MNEYNSLNDWIREYSMIVDERIWDIIDIGLSSIFGRHTPTLKFGLSKNELDNMDNFFYPELPFIGLLQTCFIEDNSLGYLNRDANIPFIIDTFDKLFKGDVPFDANASEGFIFDEQPDTPFDPAALTDEQMETLKNCFVHLIRLYSERYKGGAFSPAGDLSNMLATCFSEGGVLQYKGFFRFCWAAFDASQFKPVLLPDDPQFEAGDIPDEELLDEDDDEYEDEYEQPENISMKAQAITVSGLRKEISEKVLGQDSAVRKFIQEIYSSELKEKNSKGPRATFLFVGPPGVGKTLMANTAANLLGRPYKCFSMSLYAGPQSFESLVGFASTFKDAAPGKLTEFIKENPNAVIIFDEIEKADKRTIQIFLSLLNDGFIEDQFFAKDIDCRNVIAIFTTNAGRSFYEENRDMLISDIPEATLVSALKDDKSGTQIPPEILSRLESGCIIGFNHMQPGTLIKLIRNGFKKGAEDVSRRYGIECSYDSLSLPYIFLFQFGTSLDARVASSRSSKFMNDCVFDILERIGDGSLDTDPDRITKINFDVVNNELTNRLIVDTSVKTIMLISYKRHREFFDPAPDSSYNIIYAWSTEEQTDIKQKLADNDIDAIFVDPYMGSIEGEDEESEILDGVVHMNTHGNRALKWLMQQGDIPPVYAVELKGRIHLTDRKDLLALGVTDVIDFICTRREGEPIEEYYDRRKLETRTKVEDLLYDIFLSKRLDEMMSKGRALGFDTGIKADEDSINVTLYNFRSINNMPADQQDVVVSDADKPLVKFDDVIGAEDAKEELKRFVSFIKDPDSFKKTGMGASKGILLYGPPGTGKTMLAKALAGEADCPFISTTGADFVNGTKSIKDIFSKARRYSPSVVFIDEIDAFALNRDDLAPGSNRALLTNELLTAMDGFSSGSQKPVFVIAATNAASAPSLNGQNVRLDPALLRRFAKQVYVDLPTQEERARYVKLWQEKLGELPYSLNSLSEEDINEFARLTTGRSLANIENSLELARSRAAEEDTEVTLKMLINSFEDLHYGEKLIVDEDYLRSTAIHEAGHAFMGFHEGERFYPEYATIVARANFLGLVMQRSDDTARDRSLADVLSDIRISLAGRAAELVFTGESGNTAGASNDLEQATYSALLILCRFGMEPGFLVSRPITEKLPAKYFDKAEEIIERELNNTIDIIKQNKDKVEAIANALLEKSRIDTAEMERLIGLRPADEDTNADEAPAEAAAAAVTT